MLLAAGSVGCASTSGQVQKDLLTLDQRIGELERVNRRLLSRIEVYDETVQLLDDQVRSMRLAQAAPRPLPRVRITPTTRSEEFRQPLVAQQPAPQQPIPEEEYVDIVISNDVVEQYLEQPEGEQLQGDPGHPAPRRFTPKATVVQGDRLPVRPLAKRAPTQSEPAPADAISIYKVGLKQYREGAFKEAITSFERFLSMRPPEDYVDNALYWLGDCHYGLGDYARAATLFHQIVKEHPSANKVPDALLKVGLTYQKLNKKDSAKEVLYYLIEAYPKSEAARIARDKLSNASGTTPTPQPHS